MFVILKEECMNRAAAREFFGEWRKEPMKALAEVLFYDTSRYYFLRAQPGFQCAAVNYGELVWKTPDCPDNFMHNVKLEGYTWYDSSYFHVIGTAMTNRATSSLLKR